MIGQWVGLSGQNVETNSKLAELRMETHEIGSLKNKLSEENGCKSLHNMFIIISIIAAVCFIKFPL